MRLLIAMLVGGVLAAQAQLLVPVFGLQGRWLRQADIEAITRVVAPHGGPPWMFSAVRRTIPNRNKEFRWFAYAYLAPTRATAAFRRGVTMQVSTEYSTDELPDLATWKVEPSRVPMRWAQVALPGRAFEDVPNERDENWPIGVTDDISDADLLSIVRYVRSRPLMTVPPGLNLAPGPLPGFIRAISPLEGGLPAFSAARVTIATSSCTGYWVALERRQDTWAGTVTGPIGCGDALSSNPTVPPQR